MALASLWLAVALIALIAELLTVQLIGLYVMAGSLAAALVAALGAPLWLQVCVLASVALLGFITTYRPLRRMIDRRSPLRAMNIDAMVGRAAIVAVTIDNLASAGSVDVDGEEWRARSVDGEIIELKAEVRIERVDGVTLWVKRQKAV